MKACDLVVRYLVRHLELGCVFTYAGGTNALFLDALHRGDVPYMPMRHEANAAFAAEGYARATGRTGVALAMSGPGATNLVTGIANAYFDSSRVLYLTGQVVSRTYKGDRPIRQLGYQETDIVSIVRPVTKLASLVMQPEQILPELRRALAAVASGRPGPVLLDIPFDLQKADLPDSLADAPPPVAPPPLVSEALLGAVDGELRAARRPVILAGGGIRLAGATDALRAVAEAYRIPVVVSLLGKDAFPNDHPLYVGFVGSYGNRAANIAIQSSDLVFVVGSRLDSRQTASPDTFAPRAKKIHVDIDKEELNNTVRCDLTVQADVGELLEKLSRHAGERPAPARAAWLGHVARVKADLARDGIEDAGGVSPVPFFGKLAAAAPADAIFCLDVGSHQMWAAKGLAIRAGQRFLCSGGLGSMGFALPAAIGARVGTGRPTIAVLGDGGLQMSIAELSTLALNKLPVKIVLMNNGVLGLMKNFQDENFQGAYPATVWGYGCPDFRKVAEAYGIPAMALDGDGDVDGALERLLQAPGPALLDVSIDPERKPYPKVLPGKPLEHQTPVLDEAQLAALMRVPEECA